jgi:hypothetical protein
MANLFSTDHFMPGWHCVGHDQWWGWITVLSAALIMTSYLIIAYKQYCIIFKLPCGPSRTSLATNTNIFTLCGICSYLFLIIMMWWPVWQFRAILMILLAIASWRNVLELSNLKATYGQVQEKAVISDELISQQLANKELVKKIHEIKSHTDKLADSVVFNVNDDTSIKTLMKIEEIRAEINRIDQYQKDLEKLIQKTQIK